jgi:hypothetical protein
VAFGSLTVFGGSISTDARFVEAATNTLLVTFNETGQSQGDVIGHINAFCRRGQHPGLRPCNRRGRFPRHPTPAPAPAATPVDPDQANPEKKIWASGDGGMRIQATNPDTDEADNKLWRSRRFSLKVKASAWGMWTAMVNTEVVFASDKSGHGIPFQGQANFSRWRHRAAAAPDRHWFDVADINGNGRAEIFISWRSQ